ncbi:SDR family NAD(P)-dependent oxidoreductase [uncultured Serinicoccus sp.]|uniref:SDR family oxidoreductase n=1 Tax=uncultured Serinicoccus sp. TaxID=735514 RepID=UPI00263302ED|nr:SDR family NAD(P)-dependent oxidoreductase [uncultured Serinicoccus sp.]
MRTAVVTGAAVGIGQGIATHLQASGYRVLAVDVDESGLVELSTADPELLTVVGSVAEEATWRRVLLEADGHGGVDVLVNNAGISPKHDGASLPLVEVPRLEWEQVLAVNLTAAFLGMQAVVPGMQQRGWGRIINIASQAARTGARLAGIHYGASKAGMLGLTRTAAHQLGGDGITVNAVTPGRIMTPMAQQVSEEVNAGWLSAIPVGRFGEALDIAHVAEFLASERSSFITGATIDCNGGSFMG